MLSMPDYHMHTTLCNHAVGTMEAYVEKAIASGLTEMGFSEHMPLMPEPHLCMTYADLPVYVDRIKKLQDNYSDRITIRLGAEMDMDLNRTDEISEILNTYPFDYIIGSIHYLNDWPFDQEQYKHRFKEEAIEALYGRFFETVIAAAKSDLYDIAGHIDNLKRMGYHPPEGFESVYDELARVFVQHGITVEINTSGYDYPAEEAYPSSEILSVLYRHNVPVTAGSDAHKPEDVARYFERGCEILSNVGYDEITCFNNRKRVMKPLRPCKTGTGADN